MKGVSKEKRYLQKIPYLVLEKENQKDFLGTIFLYHGWSSCKENYEFIGGIYALNDFQVIVPDSINHGERGSLSYEEAEVMEENFWKTVINSVDEYFVIKKALQDEGRLASDKLILTGSSMGGMIASGIFAKDQVAAGLAVMNGACDWADLDRRIKEGKELDRQKGIEPALLASYNPAANKENFLQRPILIQHGDNDNSVPIETQEAFYNSILGYYKTCPDKLRFTKIANLNHHKTTGMIEECLNWFIGL